MDIKDYLAIVLALRTSTVHKQSVVGWRRETYYWLDRGYVGNIHQYVNNKEDYTQKSIHWTLLSTVLTAKVVTTVGMRCYILNNKQRDILHLKGFRYITVMPNYRPMSTTNDNNT